MGSKNWLPQKYGQSFRKEFRPLTSGGEFEFDAVSADNMVVANISTSSGITARGKYPAAKVQKIRADILFLTMAVGDMKFIVLTERNMFELWQNEKRKGRVPFGIDFVYAELPEALQLLLEAARAVAAKEVTPRSDFSLIE